jgi:hypothetical protein
MTFGVFMVAVSPVAPATAGKARRRDGKESKELGYDERSTAVRPFHT